MRRERLFVRAQPFRRTLLAAFLFVSLFLAHPSYGGANASPPAPAHGDAGGPATDSPRGTTRPLPRNASPLSYALRALLVVPYGATRAITWPVEEAALLNEKHRISERITSLMFGNLSGGRTTTGIFFGYESGIGVSVAGVTTDTPDFLFAGATLKMKTGYLTSRENRISLRYRTAPGRISFDMKGRFDHRKNRPFYGIGPDSRDNDTYADLRRAILEGTVSTRLSRWFLAAVTGYVRDLRLSEADDRDNAADFFPALYATAEKSRYAGVEMTVAADSRNRGGYSSSGTLVRLTGGFNRATSGGDADYGHYAAEAQVFINLYRHTRILALRAFAEGVEPKDSAPLPYTELEHVGGKNGLRGFGRDRFVDRKMALLTGEYRYRATEHIFGTLFAEWGGVAGEWDEFKPGDLFPSYGAGLLFGSKGDRLTVTAAISREEANYYIGAERIFSGRSRRFR